MKASRIWRKEVGIWGRSQVRPQYKQGEGREGRMGQCNKLIRKE